MTVIEIELIEVDPAELEPSKGVAAQQESAEKQIEDTKLFIQNMFRNSGVER